MFPLPQLHHEGFIPLMPRPSLRYPHPGNGPFVGKGTRRGLSPGVGYWAEPQLCRAVTPGWRPFMLESWTSAPAPWCPPAGSFLPLTASSASTMETSSRVSPWPCLVCSSVESTSWQHLKLQLFFKWSSDEGVKLQKTCHAATLTSLYEHAIFNQASSSSKT